MENLLTFALIVVLFLVAAVIAYTFVTNKIIKDQDREIEELKHKIELKDINIDYLEKSRAQYKEYFDNHRRLIISSAPFVSSSPLDKAIAEAKEAISKARKQINGSGQTDYFKDF